MNHRLLSALALLAACRTPPATDSATPAPSFVSGPPVSFSGQPMTGEGGQGGTGSASAPAEGGAEGPRWQPGEGPSLPAQLPARIAWFLGFVRGKLGRGPSLPAQLPARIAWSCTETRSGKDGGSESVPSVFLAEGSAFRMEQEDPRKGTHAIVSDGKTLTISVAGATRLPSPSDVDLRVRYGSLFEGDLARASVLGKEKVGERECWHMKMGQASGEENLSQGSLEIWLDLQDNSPRRIVTTTPDGARIELACEDLPAALTWSAADLDPAAPGVKFVDKLGK
jgi:hypothetical protein